jgi:hypothetical protein
MADPDGIEGMLHAMREIAPNRERRTVQLNIDLSPEISERLAQAARIGGVNPAKLLESLIAQYLPTIASTSDSAAPQLKFNTPQERIAAMDAVAAQNANLSILPDSAFDLENIYEGTL